MARDDGSNLSRRLHRDGEPGSPARPAIDADGWDERVDWSADAAAADARRFIPVTPPPSFERRDLDRIEADALDRRRQLWRDTALLLSGLVAALLVANLVLPQIAGIAPASPSPGASGLSIGPSPSAQGAVRATQPPSAGPGAGTGAPSTPTPAVTLPPTGTHPPSTPKPIVTPRPTRPPTQPPTQRPPTQPPPTPEPTPDITPAPAKPHADFSWSQEVVSSTVDFTDTSTGEIDSWSWDFGDGGSASSPSPSHDFGGPGIWQVTLTVTGPGGQDSVTMTVTVI